MNQQPNKVEIMKNNPIGVLLAVGKEWMEFTFWQRPWPDRKTAWQNAVTGLVNHALMSKEITLDEIVEAIQRVNGGRGAKA